MDEKIMIHLRTIEDVKKFVKVTTSFKSDVDIMAGRAVVDAKSILGVFSLYLLQNLYVRIISDDPDECARFRKDMEGFA